MDRSVNDRLELVLEQIGRLPKGNLTVRNIRGKERLYLQWTEDGKRQSRYIRRADEAMIRAQVAERKRLEVEYQELLNARYRAERGAASTYGGSYLGHGTVSRGIGGEGFVREVQDSGYETNVMTGPELQEMTGRVRGKEHRACMALLEKFLASDMTGRVCLLYGLRRTGKTTIVLQAVAELPESETAYIKMMTSDDMGMLNRDLRRLAARGFRYVFIDEVTLLSDFIDSASLLSDVYAMQGMKIVLSGTDSLGFLFAGDGELYDRTVTVHTTFIPFREYVRLLGIRDLDEYIRYGGTLRAGEIDFDDPSLADESLAFRDDESTRRYIDTSIARNIQHSLACYRQGGHFRHLLDLYEAGELTGAVNRIIEDMNHRFLLSVLTREFESHDLGSARQILRKRAAQKGEENPLELVDTGMITERLKGILEIRDSDERAVPLTQEHVQEIRAYLARLELIRICPAESIDGEIPAEHILFTQPGMRYCQAQALVHALMKDRSFSTLSAEERREITELILEEVRGRLLEEIVLLETIQRLPEGKRAFKLFFPVGEIDMVIWDEGSLECELYEIKHSDRRDPRQYQHLIDQEKCRQIEFRYGRIVNRTVLYRGENGAEGDVCYRNIEDYLLD